MPTSQPLSCSPTLASHKIKELHKQLKITKKRQEVECAAHLWHKEEEHREHKEKERKDRKEKVQKEAEVKVQREKEEKEKWEHAEKEKGKEKVSGMPIVTYPASNQHYRRLSPCCWCLDQGYECEEPLAGTKGTMCPRCAKLHIMCKQARMEGDEEEEEEEVPEQRKCMWPEVVIPVMGPSQVAAPPLKDTIWALLKKVVGVGK